MKSVETKCIELYLITKPGTAKFIDKLSVLMPKKKKVTNNDQSKVSIVIDRVPLSSNINDRNGS